MVVSSYLNKFWILSYRVLKHIIDVTVPDVTDFNFLNLAILAEAKFGWIYILKSGRSRERIWEKITPLTQRFCVITVFCCFLLFFNVFFLIFWRSCNSVRMSYCTGYLTGL